MSFLSVKKYVVLACLAILALSKYAQAADDAVQPTEPASINVSDLASLNLDQQSFMLGLAYTQMTYKATRANTPGNTEITDNGAPSPIIELSSSEKVLENWPMQIGNALLGWSVNASASVFDTHYQILDSALRGQNIGTNVSGEYVGVAPILFLKLGPLYPGSDLYLKAGGGVGPGLLKGSGTAAFNGTIYPVGSSSPVLALYRTAFWQFQAGHWYFDIMGSGLQAQNGTRSSLESYGFGVAYRFKL